MGKRFLSSLQIRKGINTNCLSFFFFPFVALKQIDSSTIYWLKKKKRERKGFTTVISQTILILFFFFFWNWADTTKLIGDEMPNYSLWRLLTRSKNRILDESFGSTESCLIRSKYPSILPESVSVSLSSILPPIVLNNYKKNPLRQDSKKEREIEHVEKKSFLSFMLIYMIHLILYTQTWHNASMSSSSALFWSPKSCSIHTCLIWRQKKT